MQFDLVRGPAADRLIADRAFCERWTALLVGCPWATMFQSPEFVRVWFGTYRERYEPLVVVGTDASGELAGLLTLAIDVRTRAVAAAGTHHAEYQVWLARPADGDAFIEGALSALGASGWCDVLRLSFIPPAAPMSWASSGREWAGRCDVTAHSRGLMNLGTGVDVAASLRKKSNKSRLNRLERLGPLSFEQLHSAAEIEPIFDTLIDFCDLRQGAVNGAEPFRNDPLKRPFHAAMMDAGHLLHTTVMRAGEHFISAQLNWLNRGEVVLGLITHSPFVAHHSPGKLHMLLAGRLLVEQDVEVFDLSPGGDYKDRFATGHDVAHSLNVHFRGFSRARARVRRSATTAVKSALERAGVGTASLGALAKHGERLQQLRVTELPARVARRMERWAHELREARLYAFDVKRLGKVSNPCVMQRDALRDLLAMGDDDPDHAPRQKFLSSVLERLEKGDHVYTLVKDGRLVQYGWLVERQDRAFLDDVGQEFRPPPNTAILYDFYTHPGYVGHGLFRACLSQMLHEAAAIPNTERVHIDVLADNLPIRQVVESLGFEYYGSLFSATRLGKVSRWSSLQTPAIDAPAPEALTATEPTP